MKRRGAASFSFFLPPPVLLMRLTITSMITLATLIASSRQCFSLTPRVIHRRAVLGSSFFHSGRKDRGAPSSLPSSSSPSSSPSLSSGSALYSSYNDDGKRSKTRKISLPAIYPLPALSKPSALIKSAIKGSNISYRTVVPKKGDYKRTLIVRCKTALTEYCKVLGGEVRSFVKVYERGEGKMRGASTVEDAMLNVIIKEIPSFELGRAKAGLKGIKDIEKRWMATYKHIEDGGRYEDDWAFDIADYSAGVDSATLKGKELKEYRELEDAIESVRNLSAFKPITSKQGKSKKRGGGGFEKDLMGVHCKALLDVTKWYLNEIDVVRDEFKKVRACVLLFATFRFSFTARNAEISVNKYAQILMKRQTKPSRSQQTKTNNNQ